MAEESRPALGLSIGATSLAAVTADHAISRTPVLTLYRQRPPEIGVPSENPRLGEPGLVISDFVDRVGDPIGIVASDGSLHRSEALVADALRGLAYAATGGRTLPENVTVAYPAHWGPKSVDALGAALSRVSEWSHRARPLTLIPDAAATLFAVRANPGIPARGVVAVCDFGGSGTSITLVDAAAEYQPLAPTMRYNDFSGDLVDQALLTAVMANVTKTGSFDPAGTSAIGSLSRLRGGCRSAKEQLSSSTVATLSDELPGVSGDLRLTRNELDDAIRDPLNGFLAVLDETIRRSGIRGSELVAVVSVGGGANIPAVTTMLSGHLRVPVVTTPRPQLTAAIGGALRASRGRGDAVATAMTPAASMTATALASPVPAGARVEKVGAAGARAAESAGPMSALMPALAWSAAADESRAVPASGRAAARPALKFEQPPQPGRPEKKAFKNSVIPWHRLPAAVILATAVAILLVGMAVAIGFDSGDKPANTPAPSTTSAPPASAPAPQQAPAPAQPTDAPPPAAGGGDAPPPASVAPATPAAPAPAPPAAPAPAPPPAPAPTVPRPAPAPTVPQPAPAPTVPQVPAIPPIPQIPGLGQIVPGLAGVTGLGAPHPAAHGH